MAKWKLVALFLAQFGVWGVGAAALLDSSTIPIPMDALLAVYVWNDKSHFWLYCLLASVGSAIGGLLPYWLGRAGGELFLLKRVNRRRYERIRARFERQEFLAMMIPSMLPPPTPWKACCPSFAVAWSAGWCYRCWCSSWVRARWVWWRTMDRLCWPSSAGWR
jgi:membrane protein YqaA with SNARE-associated domain